MEIKEQNQQQPQVYLLYHANCTDGTGAKFAAWKKFGDHGAKYIPVQYGKPVPDMEPDSEVYIVDFSYPKDVLEQLRSVHRSVVVLDHHKTAQEALEGVEGCVFDMHKSGAVLAWEYFHPGAPVPNLLLDIQDRDLWKFKRPNSRLTHAALQLTKGNMHTWDDYATHEGCYEDMVADGHVLVLKQQMDVEGYVKKKIKIISFKGYKVGVTNSGDLASEIGNGICLSKDLNVDFAIVYCITSDNEVLLSLRSDGDFDVAKIAETLGGGGHKNAAGCKISLETLVRMLRGRM